MQKVLIDLKNGDEFCIRSPHLEGAELFGSQQHKTDTPIGVDDETHRPDTFNFSHIFVAQRTTRSHTSPLPSIIKKSSPFVLEVPSPPTGLDFC